LSTGQGCARAFLTPFLLFPVTPPVDRASPKSAVQPSSFLKRGSGSKPMRFLRLLSPLWLFLASVGRLGTPGADTAPESGTPSEDEIRIKSAYWHDECVRDWDRQNAYDEAGVVTKKEWADTCHASWTTA
jgi:hypothetical protein